MSLMDTLSSGFLSHFQGEMGMPLPSLLFVMCCTTAQSCDKYIYFYLSKSKGNPRKSYLNKTNSIKMYFKYKTKVKTCS